MLDEAELKNVPVREYVRFSEDGHFLWPGYRDNLRPLIWLLQLNNGEVTGTQTPVGILPTIEELDLEGCDIAPDDLEQLLTMDIAVAAGDRKPRRVPRPVRQPAGGDLGGAPPRHCGPPLMPRATQAPHRLGPGIERTLGLLSS